VANTFAGRYSQAIHPLHAVLLAGSVALFLAAALSDLGYAASHHFIWTLFASWLVAGGLLLAGLALLFVAFDLVRAHRRVDGIGRYALVLLVAWLLGFLNALVHAGDAWASMPAGLILSVIVTLLAAAATWLAFSNRHTGATR
jgi:uncharacterized membrane protein